MGCPYQDKLKGAGKSEVSIANIRSLITSQHQPSTYRQEISDICLLICNGRMRKSCNFMTAI